MSKRRDRTGADSKYFTGTKKGELSELRAELALLDTDRVKEAVKKIIAAMTVGKDVNPLFPAVVNCMQTSNIELKKLIYLYMINYAKSNPEMAIMGVNTFVRDSKHDNPLVRALAVRTMGCIRVERITEYLCEPLRACLEDEMPYVRKTAAICVAKLYDINPMLVESQGFLGSLRELLCDSNPTVVANAVAALHEISEMSGKDELEISGSVLSKLLAAINECTEWGQVFILDALARYTPASTREAEGIIERITPRLSHKNAAVILSAVKVILLYMEMLESSDVVRSLTRKIAPPLVTLLSAQPEIQYVALRNITLIVQKRPNVLSHEFKVFFCKYNDPIYVKMEKLNILIKLATERNINHLLLDFKEYASEVDVDFVRSSVRAIGRCAIKLERAAEKCINVLLELIHTQVNYVVQEAIIVIKDIFRRYPNRYESIIATLCENLESLDEPEAKASMVWIIGEYAERIDNADELLESFLDGFYDEPAQVQLQLLTATVKLFLKRPGDTQDMVTKVLNMATEDSDNPDLRDRGYVYWRLLSTDPEAARAVVLSEKPVIRDDTFSLEPSLLDSLIGHISMLASVYHKPPESFVVRSHAGLDATKYDDDDDEDSDDDDYDDDDDDDDGDDDDYDDDGDDDPAAAAAEDEGEHKEAPPPELDIFGSGGLPSPSPLAPAAAAAPAATGVPASLTGVPAAASPAAAAPAAAAAVPSPATLTLFFAGTAFSGVAAQGRFARRDGRLLMDIAFKNDGAAPFSQFALQLQKNPFGVCPLKAGCQLPAAAEPGSVGRISVPCGLNPAHRGAGSPVEIVGALKNMHTGVVAKFKLRFFLHFICTSASKLEDAAFQAKWAELGATPGQEVAKPVPAPPMAAGDICAKLAAGNLHFSRAEKPSLFFSTTTEHGLQLLFELKVVPGGALPMTIRTTQPRYAALLHASVQALLAA
eukprot:PLAT5568.3.p2 GENE.PLAT5568.3~~PLAT5568.3.p2  ORF type:complete len:938 (+),score=612.81 PLAT5568.3:117-2930(+)